MFILVQSAETSPRLPCTVPTRTMPPQHDQFFFPLDLPPEIRNVIYEYVFAGSTTTVLSQPRGHCLVKHITSDHLHRFGMPALLQVSKQLRSEATGIFYANTKIVANETQRLVAFLKGVEKKYRKMISCVQVDAFLPDEWDLSQVRLEVFLIQTVQGYLAFSPRYTDLDMTRCKMEARTVSRETGQVLWPKMVLSMYEALAGFYTWPLV